MTDQIILVVDDDPKITGLLRNVLEGEGFGVLEAENEADVLNQIATAPISLITLDIHLGSLNGLDLARAIRRVSRVPIVMVTGKGDVIDRVVGLEVGADDYITKPFHIKEVVARIRSVLRRAEYRAAEQHPPRLQVQGGNDPEEDAQFRFDRMTADPGRLTLVDRAGGDCGLTSGDFKLLMVFLHRPTRVLSRDQLMDLTGGVDWSPLDRTIDNQIARLRKKIERDPSDPKMIKTVRGVGYVFACDVEKIRRQVSPAKEP